MIVAGKCPPEPEELEKAKERGFDKVELYLEKKHLNNFKESLENVESSSVEAVSVHTPHVHLDDKAYLLLADRLAQELNAYLVFHSQYMHHTHLPELEKLDIEADYGYENNPGVADTMLQDAIVDKGHEIVLDTVHFYLGDHDTDDFREFLNRNLQQINVIHLCDSSSSQDGLAFGEGEMNMKEICQIIDQSDFDGTLVLEVMPDHQKDAKEKWENYTS